MMDREVRLWVVKFQVDPTTRRSLINDYLATKIAAAVGFSVPHVSPIRNSAKETIGLPLPDLASRTPRALHFGSEYAGGLMPGQVSLWNAGSSAPTVRNPGEFAAILVLDLWLKNADRRQAVIVRNAHQKIGKAVFIDHDRCFGGSNWNYSRRLRTSERQTFIAEIARHQQVDLSPWLDNLREFNREKLMAIVESIPQEWVSGQDREFESLITTILPRMKSCLTLCEKLGYSSRRQYIGPTARLLRINSLQLHSSTSPRKLCGRDVEHYDSAEFRRASLKNDAQRMSGAALSANESATVLGCNMHCD